MPNVIRKKNEKEKDEKKEAPADNPFLKNVDTTSAADDTDVEGSSVKTRAYVIDISQNYEFSTKEYTSSRDANTEWNNASESHYSNSWNAYKDDIVKQASSRLNSMYAYRPVKERLRFKRLDSDKHPEFSTFDNATKAMEVILTKTRYNQNIDQIEKDLEPILDYFNKLATKLELSKEKADKRLRGAAWYNLAQAYYCLDQHDKAIEIGNKIIASEYEENTGKRFIKNSEEMKKKLAFHKMSSRHIVPKNDEEAKEAEGETIEAEEEEK